MSGSDSQDTGEVSMQVDCQFGFVLIRGENNLLNQRTNMHRGFVTMLRLVHRADEPLYRAVIAFRHLRMNIDRRFLPAGQRMLQSRFTLLQAVNLVTNENGVDTVFDGLHQLGDLALNAFQFGAVSQDIRILFHPNAIEMRGIFFAENGAEIGIHEPVTQCAKHRGFQLGFADRQPVRTGAFVPCSGTAILGCRNLRIATAAIAALEQERKQLLWTPLCSVIALRVQILLHGFHAVPQFLIDDAKLRHLGTDPCGFVIHPSVLAARIGVFEVALLPPDLHPDIQLIVQNTGATAAIAIDRASSPCPTTLRGNAFRIQFDGDLTRRFALGVFLENPAHDGGLLFVNGTQAADAIAFGIITRLNIVTVRPAACALAIHGALLQAAMGTAGKVFEIER
nr:hypothetical protein [Sphingosinithalassobacter tenebrarum]